VAERDCRSIWLCSVFTAVMVICAAVMMTSSVDPATARFGVVANVGTVLTTPSGNIFCYTSNGEFGPFDFACRVRETAAKRCGSSQQVSVRWRATRRVAARRPVVSCNSAFDPRCCGRGVTLAYGHSLRIPLWNVTCASRFEGLTCVGGGRHGFFLSRESLRSW
jgi:uncharacterized protein DUF6636